jgi:murein DD-endopeptidase MepM/ murein hydrolase activator NlpD
MQARAGQNIGPDTAPVSLAFGAHGARAVAERIRLIRDAHPGARLPLAGSLALLLLPALCGASVLLQPQFAWRDADEAAPVKPAWQAPLAHLRVTGSFGDINRPGARPHQGVDFGTARGTAVRAPADGKVAISTDQYEGGARYGKVVVIEHAGGTRSLYAHLDTRLVRPGERVRAGQQIALSGATGKVTGPHLHFEVSRQGAPVDPQALLKGTR